ncbi:MAG: glycosyltransferase family 1 protein [bacterium]
MKIALDASCAARPQPTGVAAYARNLIRHLAALDAENAYCVGYRLSRIKYRDRFVRPRQPNFRVRLFHDWPGLRLPRDVDVFHGLDARISQGNGSQTLATFHDIGLILHPEFGTARHRDKILRRYEQVCRQADWILAVSRHTGRDLQEHFGVPERKIRVIHEGVEERFRPLDRAHCADVLEHYGLAGPYVLFLGGLSYRKNVSRMLDAFSGLDPKSCRGVKFVIGGETGHGAEPLLEQIGSPDLRDRVRWIGYVPPEVLPCLYSQARAFCFVTLYEGFGLPVLEAMACGTPVVAATTGSLPEVAGDAALLVDPCDTGRIRAALLEVLEDAGSRERLQRAGRARAREFSWRKAAEGTLAYYRDICRCGRG